MASPRAVSIRIGVSARPRRRRHTSSPSMSGSIRSSTNASKGSRAWVASPSAPVAAWLTRNPASPRYSRTIAARRRSSSISRMRSATPGSSAMPMPPMAKRFETLGQGAALIGIEHIGGVAERLGDPLAGRLGERHLVGAQPLDCGAIDARRGEQSERLLAVRHGLLAQRQEVVDGRLCDGDELGLLLGRRIGFDSHVLDGTLYL